MDRTKHQREVYRNDGGKNVGGREGRGGEGIREHAI